MGGKYESLLYKAIFFCIRRLVDMGAINIMNMDHALAKVNLVIQDAIGVENIIIKHKQPEPEKSETSNQPVIRPMIIITAVTNGRDPSGCFHA